MTELNAQIKAAAAMILLRNPSNPQVFWVQRSLALKFMGGFQAFPGGQLDVEDFAHPVLNCTDANEAAMRVCAVREVFEETGLLIARGVERFTNEALRAMRDELESGAISFTALLQRESLQVDAAMMEAAPRWVTPPPAPKRFNTHFYAAWVPPCKDGEQVASVRPGELDHGNWIQPADAVEMWRRGEILIAPPVLMPLLALANGTDGFVERLHSQHALYAKVLQAIEFRYGFTMVALRTPTLPPATHTNCFLVGHDEIVIIDPGSPYEEEQAKLDAVLDDILAAGRTIREIIITHLHHDHIGGVNHLVNKYGLAVATHRLTAEAIAPDIKTDRFIEDDDLITLAGDPGWNLRAIWSPGHTRGHLSFLEERTGSLITGDCIVGLGTVVIAPPEGNMQEYLASLERLLQLPKLTALFPAHGPIVADTRGKIQEYLTHRHEREAMIVRCLEQNEMEIAALVQAIYSDVPVTLHALAAQSVLAHLEKLLAENRVREQAGRYSLI